MNLNSFFTSRNSAPETPIGTQLALSDARVGKIYMLVSLDAGQQLREKIASMGLNSGVKFTIIANSGHGPVGLEVRQTRLGIGRGMALKIRVKEIDAL